MDGKIVPSLQDLAFEVSFKEIMSTLILCYEHRPKGKRLSCLASPSAFSKSFLTSEKLINFVRRRLDYHLVGLVGVQVRKKYIKRFYDVISKVKGKTRVDVWVFLDAVLDESFTKLKTHIAYRHSAPSTKLIPTIAKRSPLLQKLTINFEPIEDGYEVLNGGQMVELKSAIRSLRSLQHLTHLFLLDSEERLTVLSLIGEACPSLFHLSLDVTEIEMEKEDILALIFGEFINNLMALNYYSRKCPSWCEDESLQHLVLPSEYLTPICHSLREFRFFKNSDEEEGHNDVTDSVATFFLRHLPLLQKMDKRIPTSLAVMNLHKNSITEEEDSQEEFQKAIREATERTGTTPPQRNLNATSFSGKLFLTKLDFVNVTYEAMLRAVGETCPMLKEVVFCDVSFTSNIRAVYGPNILLDNDVDPVDLQSIFSGWPKLTKIGFHRLSSKYISPILQAFGPELQHIEFKCYETIQLADLALCRQLESLRFLYDQVTLIPLEMDSTFDAATFLPKLKSFESEVCLGRHSLLFEEKSTLVRLVLDCSHISNEVVRNEPLPKREPTTRTEDICNSGYKNEH